MDIERMHLGLDHSVLGRRLAQKWNLPEPIISAVWLHHCDAQTLAADVPHAQLARVVALADRLVRKWELGQSGSFDTPDSVDELASLLRIPPAQLEEIGRSVTEKVNEKVRQLGLTASDGTAEYYSVIHRTAADLVRDNRSLGRLQMAEQRTLSQQAITEEFLSQAGENSSAVELAQQFASVWRKHCATGLTGVYVVADPTEPWIELAAYDRKGTLEVKTLRLPESVSPIPEAFSRCTGTIAADDGVRQLIQQTGFDYDLAALQMAPLKMGDKIVAVLFYEQLTPDDRLSDMLLLSGRIAASTIAMALAVQKQYELSERFVEIMNSLRRTRTELARTQSLAGLAELAAGAAHELNNPLAVISGRVQLLLDCEQDETKKQMLLQIQGRTAEISEIISNLMDFARPKEPDRRSITLAELLKKAADTTKQINGLSSLEADLSGDGLLDSVYVDISQVTQSLSHILTNAIQSYKGDNGPLWVECRSSKDSVDVVIRDKGCGMDPETLAKAAEPFFSFKPAGRRRGMGLANSQRLLKLNGGSLKLDSSPGQGTTVTVTLPKV
jgi:signal transduction histidine kinase